MAEYSGPQGEPGATGAPPEQPAAEPPQAAPPGYYQYPHGYGYYPATPKRPSRTWIIVVVVVAVVFLAGMMGFAAVVAAFAGGAPAFGDQIGVIYITGPIFGTGSSLFGASVGTQSVAQQLKRAERHQIRAVILRIDSPGGAAGASQEIYNLIRDFRERTEKPVIASMGDVAASGGYYVAAAADKIVANRATMTGSIGVRMGSFEAAEFLQKYGIQSTGVTSGKYKDTGSMFRHMWPDEREYLQSVVSNVYEQFVADVAQGRNMKIADVKKLADGRVFTGDQAKQKGLLDVLGGFDVAIDEARKAAGLTGEVSTVNLRPPSPFEELFGPLASASQEALLQRELLRRLGSAGAGSLAYDPGPAAHLLECPVLAPAAGPPAR